MAAFSFLNADLYGVSTGDEHDPTTSSSAVAQAVSDINSPFHAPPRSAKGGDVASSPSAAPVDAQQVLADMLGGIRTLTQRVQGLEARLASTEAEMYEALARKTSCVSRFRAPPGDVKEPFQRGWYFWAALLLLAAVAACLLRPSSQATPALWSTAPRPLYIPEMTPHHHPHMLRPNYAL